jgi:hypothetical protein
MPPHKPSKYSSLLSLGFQPSTVIDIGTWNETIALKTLYPDAFHHLFEPDHNRFDVIHRNYQGLRYQLHTDAVSDLVRPAAAIGGPVDNALIKVDTDGDEVKILDACEELFPFCPVLVVECLFTQMSDVMQTAERFGYHIYDIVDIGHNGHWVHQFDAIYVRPEFERPGVTSDRWHETWSLSVDP